MKHPEAYLEGFHEISVLIPYDYHDGHVETFFAEGKDETITLELQNKKQFDHYVKYTLHFTGYIFLNRHYEIVDNHGGRYELYSGEVVRTELFDELFFYDGDDLGFTYTEEKTTFKLWTPVAKEVNIILFDENNEEETIPMKYTNQGVWRKSVRGDLDGQAYLFEAYVNGQKSRFNDPYGIASSANGSVNYVVDTEKFYEMENDRPFNSVYATDAVIYEASVRDFTSDHTIKSKNRGKFLGLVEENLRNDHGDPAGFDYLKTLGITHVQLLPIYDFEGVDESDPFKRYNWGYNPSQYNVPEGSYTDNPDDPYERINNLRFAIDRMHEEKLGVVMDVVYNHVYDIKTFPFEKMIPGYAFRVDANGVLTEGSGCGNDLATERKMIRKFIIDSVLYWARTFKIDGFRFDLMGLIDVTTMNILRQKLESENEHIIVYGEGWKMSAPLPEQYLAHMYNPRTLFNIGFFNDETREHIKGETFKLKARGYAMGKLTSKKALENIIQAKTHRKGAIKYPSQSINYVECHDNHTFYDKARIAMKTESEADRRRAQRLALSMIILAQGVPFIHMGQEFYRSKDGDSNSYRSSDAVNMIFWNKVSEHKEDIEHFKKLLGIRRAHPLLRLRSAYEISTHSYVRFKESGTICYELRDDSEHLIIIFKNNATRETFTFDEPFDIIYQSEDETAGTERKRVTLEKVSTTVLRQKI